MAKNPFSKLMLNIEEMQGLIELWCEDNLNDNFTVKRKDIPERIQFHIESIGKKAQLDFIKCAGGLYTISFKVGADPTVSEAIANYLLSQINNQLKDSPYANGFSTKMSEEEFEAVIGLLTSDGNSIENTSEISEPGKPRSKIIRIKGIRGDHVTLTYYYNTNRLQVQGRPHYLFQDILSLVAESIEDTDALVDNHLEMCKLSIKKDDIYEEMKSVLGEDIFNYLPSTHKAILASSFIQFKVNVPFPDYSCLIFPAYRAYEGFIRKIFKKHGLDCVGVEGFKEYFYTKDNSIIMSPMYADALSNDVAEQLRSLYVFYNKNRHPYGHASGDDFQTVIITDRNVAYSKFMEVINYIKKGYTIA